MISMVPISLNTGKTIKRRMFIPLPMSKTVIKAMDKWGDTAGPKWEFLDRNCHVFGWDNQESENSEHLIEGKHALLPDIPVEMTGMEL